MNTIVRKYEPLRIVEQTASSEPETCFLRLLSVEAAQNMHGDVPVMVSLSVLCDLCVIIKWFPPSGFSLPPYLP